MLLIGAGRVGTALHEAAGFEGISSTLIDRKRGWDALDGPAGDPIVLCVRNDDLDPILARIPPHRRADLVFVQNGAIRGFLDERGLGGVTRGLLYFAVAKRGDRISPGRTSWLTGPHATTMARFLGHCGVTAEAVDWARFTMYEFEKLSWICAFGPLCDEHQLPVGQIIDRHYEELSRLVGEIRLVGRATFNVDLPIDWLVHRLCDYSRSIPDYRASVKEWEWRNGWLLEHAQAHGIEMPTHRAALSAARHLENRDVLDP